MGVLAKHMGDAVELSIEDDGRGINGEKIRKALIKANVDRHTVIEEYRQRLAG